MTRDDYIRLHRDTLAAIELTEKHGAENCVVECSDRIHGDCWYMCDSDLSFDARYYRARLKPQPKLVPWTSLDDVPLTHWFRKRKYHELLRVDQVDPDDKIMPVCFDADWPTVEGLLYDYEHAEPRDKYSDLIWLPCGKEVVE